MKMFKYKCSRCGYVWIPRQEDAPKTCPKCRSPYYDRPRRQPKPVDYDELDRESKRLENRV